jgi:hypothetical protein
MNGIRVSRKVGFPNVLAIDRILAFAPAGTNRVLESRVPSFGSPSHYNDLTVHTGVGTDSQRKTLRD